MLLVDMLLVIVLGIPLVTAAQRRLHDTDRNGAWVWLVVIPAILMVLIPLTIAIIEYNMRGGAVSMSPVFQIMIAIFTLFSLSFQIAVILVLVWLSLPGTEGPNSYGPDPTMQE